MVKYGSGSPEQPNAFFMTIIKEKIYEKMDPNCDYQFVMIPQQLTSCLDANCGKMLTTLLGLSSLMKKEDGWFYRSNKDLQLDTRFSQNLVIATLDTLYQAGIIDVDCIGKGKGHRSNRIHINFESFKVYQQYSFNDIRNNPDLWIETVSYKNHYSPSYCKEEGKEIGNSLGNRIGKKVTTNTDTTDLSNTTNTIDITNTIEDIDNKNITNEEDYLIDFLDNPIKDFRCLLDNLPFFLNRNYNDLMTLQENLKSKCNCEYTVEEIVQSLQFLYKEKIGYAVHNR